MNDKTDAAIDWILNRLTEQSTWKGIILFLSGIGIALDPNKAATITAAGLALVGLINMLRNEKKSTSVTVQKAINDGTITITQQTK